MNTLWFIVPAQGRLEIGRACLGQLARTCQALAPDIQASAVVIADDENLETAAGLGFATVERDNTQLGRKVNDGYQAAAREGVEFMVPFGADDWVDPAWIRLPDDSEIVCANQSAVVNEDGTKLARLRITYEGGDGVRVYPRALLEKLGFRPCAEDRKRAIDSATWDRIRRTGHVRFVYHELHPLQIVDWKSAGNLNSYQSCLSFKTGDETDPWEALAEHYPAEAIQDIQGVYERRLVAA